MSTKTTTSSKYEMVIPEAMTNERCWETRLHCNLVRIDSLISRILFGSTWQNKKNRPELGVSYVLDDFGTLSFSATIHAPITWNQFKRAFKEAVSEVLQVDHRSFQYKKVKE